MAEDKAKLILKAVEKYFDVTIHLPFRDPAPSFGELEQTMCRIVDFLKETCECLEESNVQRGQSGQIDYLTMQVISGGARFDGVFTSGITASPSRMLYDFFVGARADRNQYVEQCQFGAEVCSKSAIFRFLDAMTDVKGLIPEESYAQMQAFLDGNLTIVAPDTLDKLGGEVYVELPADETDDLLFLRRMALTLG